jgi:hypothetical protein
MRRVRVKRRLTMLRTILAPTVLAATLVGATSPLAEVPMVSNVSVQVDLVAMHDKGAVARFTHLNDDLTKAITNELANAGRIGQTGLGPVDNHRAAIIVAQRYQFAA